MGHIDYCLDTPCGQLGGVFRGVKLGKIPGDLLEKFGEITSTKLVHIRLYTFQQFAHKTGSALFTLFQLGIKATLGWVL